MNINKPLFYRSILSQARGLMFRRKTTLVMVFKTEQTVSLHTFFVFYPLDILCLDKEKRIIEIKKNLSPFNFYTTKTKPQYLVEIPASIQEFNLGETVKW